MRPTPAVHLLITVRALDPAGHRVYPRPRRQTTREAEKQYSYVFWDQPLAHNTGVFVSSLKTYSRMQTHIDQAIIAMSSRSFVAHRVTSRIAFLAGIQCAARRDEWTRLQVSPPARRFRFLLYSVGWNQQDDGGAGQKVGQGRNEGLDWIWAQRKLVRTTGVDCALTIRGSRGRRNIFATGCRARWIFVASKSQGRQTEQYRYELARPFAFSCRPSPPRLGQLRAEPND